MALTKLVAFAPAETKTVVNAIADAVDSLTTTVAGGLTLASAAPASSTATGTTGQYFADSNYFYLCIATNTWVEIAVTSSF